MPRVWAHNIGIYSGVKISSGNSASSSVHVVSFGPKTSRLMCLVNTLPEQHKILPSAGRLGGLSIKPLACDAKVAPDLHYQDNTYAEYQIVHYSQVVAAHLDITFSVPHYGE